MYWQHRCILPAREIIVCGGGGDEGEDTVDDFNVDDNDHGDDIGDVHSVDLMVMILLILMLKTVLMTLRWMDH